MRKKIFCIIFLVLLGCNNHGLTSTLSPYPSSIINQLPTSYPSDMPLIPTELSAFDSYSIAKHAAEEWDRESFLYKIPATFIMEKNLGFPITGEGWFFMFKTPNSSLEYYVYIWDGKVSGTTEAQPIIISQSSEEKLRPLQTIDGLIDSDDVLNIIRQNAIHKNVQKINLELIFEQNLDFPTWVVYNFSQSSEDIIMKINAVNGALIAGGDNP